MKLETYGPALLPALVRFWNRAFAKKRNFFPVTEALFTDRVVGKRTAVDGFDPEGLVVARDGDEIVGMVHAGVRPEALCRTLDPEWLGGAQGYVALLYVEPSRRRQGTGMELWHRALERLKGTKTVVVDGQCINPFYGNSEGPFTPFWGTPEGISVEWDDSATKKFLAQKGHVPRFRGIQLALRVDRAPEVPIEAVEREAQAAGFGLEYVSGKYPEVGRPQGEARALAPELLYECVTAEREGECVGLLSYYPMKEVRPGLFGIYEAKVVERHRGKGLGKMLLGAAVERMRAQGAESCEVLTIPEISDSAQKLYLAAGFERAADWAIY